MSILFNEKVVTILLEYIRRNYDKALVFIDRVYEPILDKVIKLESKHHFYSMLNLKHLNRSRYLDVNLKKWSVNLRWCRGVGSMLEGGITELLECYTMRHKGLLVAFGGHRVMEPEAYMLGSIYVEVVLNKALENLNLEILNSNYLVLVHIVRGRI